jgi:hypothetical protein
LYGEFCYRWFIYVIVSKPVLERYAGRSINHSSQS